ncbi:alpha/beta hydrolase [Parasalinivibrio latis]|uniref:alpha/beta fold hydrolase n=1 Tax=Parasalinivibrio latis TaxID=2952610 RepID=UPI0030E45A98
MPVSSNGLRYKLTRPEIPNTLSPAESAPTMVFLHGLGSSQADWVFQLSHFENNYPCLSVDLPSHGHSTIDPDFSLPRCAGALDVLLKETGIKRPVLVGVSMGGMIAQEYAATYPDNVHSLVVINALAECRARTVPERWAIFVRNIMLQWLSLDRIAKIMAKKLLPGDDKAELRKTAQERWKANNREAYIAAFHSMFQWTATSRLDAISQPVTLIASEFDYTPVGAKKVLSHVLPDAQLLVANGANHLLPLEDPSLCNFLIEQHLNRHTLTY